MGQRQRWSRKEGLQKRERGVVVVGGEGRWSWAGFDFLGDGAGEEGREAVEAVRLREVVGVAVGGLGVVVELFGEVFAGSWVDVGLMLSSG